MPDAAPEHPAARRMRSMTPEQAEHHSRRVTEGRRAAAENRRAAAEGIRSAIEPVYLFLIAYDVATAAAITCTSERTVYAAIEAGELKAKMLGRKYLIPRAALRAWIASLPDPGASTDPEAA